MYRLPPLDYVPVFPDVPLSPAFEQFVRDTIKQMIRRSRFFSAWAIADAFRKHFHVPVPVSDLYVNRLVQDDIGVEVVGEPMEGVEAACHYNTDKGRYEIYTAYSAKEYAAGVLHDLFEIFYGRCLAIRPEYAEGWLGDHKAAQPHCLADIFAYGVIVPPVQFREAAKMWGYDPFTLANHFKVRPGIIVQAIRQHAILPCPMLTLRIGENDGNDNDFDIEDDCDPNGQYLLFAPPSEMRWKVWNSLFKRERSAKSAHYAMQQISDRAPKKEQLYTPLGFVAEALKTERSLSVTTETLFDIHLLEPVFAVARPGGKNKKNCFVQVVPLKNKDILLDIGLRAE